MTIPQHVQDFVATHQHDLGMAAMAAPSDSVLFTSLDDPFTVQIVPREEILAALKEPPEALKEPPEPAPKAIACCWVMVFEDDEVHWFSMSFFNESEKPS